MNKEDIKEYFEMFVLNYQPYKDIPEYQAIVKTLIDFYFDHSYNHINLPFKQAFEQQFIPIEFYNNLLLSIGFPKNIVSLLVEKDKKILLHSFMDYNRYKGTIDQLRLVGEKFGEDLGIYELFIDLKEINIVNQKLYTIHNQYYFNLEDVRLYDQLEINDSLLINNDEYIIRDKRYEDEHFRVYLDKIYNGSDYIFEDFMLKRWVFIPEPLYVSPNIAPVVTYLDYERIYQDTKRYFVSTEYLTASHKSENLVLPIKSNLLFLDYKKYQDVNSFYNLLAAIFLKEYYNERLVIFFRNGDYSISLGRLYKLWYYVLMKFYNYEIVDDTPTNIVSLDITNPNFDYVINDVEKLLKEYESLIDSSGFSIFYHKYITDKLYITDHQSSNISFEDYRLILENEIGTDLINYIDNRIETSSSDIKIYECNHILDEIFNSLITWSVIAKNENIGKNINYFLKILSFITYPLSMSPTYNLIMFLKPYHVELIKEISEYLKIRDIGNSAIVKSSIKDFTLKMLQASTFTMSEQILQAITYNTNLNDNAENALIIHGRLYFLSQLIKTLNIVAADLFNVSLEYIREIVNQPNSIHVVFELHPIIKSLVFALSNANIILIQNKKEIVNIIDKLDNILINLRPQSQINTISISPTIINLIDIDSSGYVFSDLDLSINLKTYDDSTLLNPPLETNKLKTTNVITHSYNLIKD